MTTRTLTPQDLLELPEISGQLKISLLAPMERAGKETRQNAIRFRKLLRRAQSELLERGWREEPARDLLEPAAQLLHEGPFWQHQRDGLAVYLGSDFFRHYKLPVGVEETVHIGDRFLVRPLVKLLSRDTPFYLLTLSQGGCRLYRGHRTQLEKVEVAHLPADIDETSRWERATGMDDGQITKNRGHKAQAGLPGQSSLASGAYHGQVAEDRLEAELQARYFRQVREAVEAVIGGEKSPLVLAGAERSLAVYREQGRYPHLVADSIVGNVEHLGPDQLHLRAWPILRKLLDKRAREAFDGAKHRLGTGLFSTRLEEVLNAAYDGRVAELFLQDGASVKGRYSPEARRVEREDGTELLDLAALQVLRTGGGVYLLEPEQLPFEGPIGASLRY